MDLVTAALLTKTGHKIADKAVDAVVDLIKSKIKGAVLERWSAHRAERFLKAFADEVMREGDVRTQSASLNDMLRKISDGEEESAAIFDAYRRVALCASRDIGPMIIGIRAAVLLKKGGEASASDEQLFMAAESLNDRDFRDFVRWAEDPKNRKGGSRPPLPEHPLIAAATVAARVDSAATRGVFSKADVAINLYSDVGPFALKLAQVGLLTQLSVSRGEPRHLSGVDHCLIGGAGVLSLLALAKRAIDAKDSAPSH
ncbi:hypothetical protein [Paraburkholderia sp.]|uniref:hypothetical protein n=1 Tax=Paraburkholderia sp. TaxID=1926495 RepID=UPI00286F8832|nr:hypothetical protein [Paraburkholderia sp.]